MSIGDVVAEGERIITRWKEAGRAVAVAESRLQSARCEHANANIELAKWLKPNNPNKEETYCIWYGNEMFSVKGDSEQVLIRVKERK